jgi:RNA polymerase sigma factor (sigma-70 family)
MPDPAEIALIRKCQEGREDAFRELVEKYQRRVYWIAYNMLSSYDHGREIAREAFIRVFRNIVRFDVKKNFYTWLYQITVNLCIDRMRKLSTGRRSTSTASAAWPTRPRDQADGDARGRVHSRSTACRRSTRPC